MPIYQTYAVIRQSKAFACATLHTLICLYSTLFYCSNFAMTAARPAIKNYLNINDYLKDLYSYKKLLDPKFSYEIWSKQLGLSNKSFLRQIIVGRRSLTEATIALFCNNLDLDSSEKEYFSLLVLYSKARSSEQRNLYGRKLRELIYLGYPQEEIPLQPDFVLKPLYPRLQTLLGFADLEKSPEALAKLLNIPVAEIQEGLNLLQKLNLAEPTPILDKIQWQGKTKAFKVPDDIGNQALLDYHQQSLLDAIKARRLEKTERRYRSLLLALKSEDFQEFLDDLEVFVKQSFHKYDSKEFSDRKLFQINFNLHAVTDRRN